MFGLGFQEILIILLVAVLLFGAGRLPEIGKSLGKAMREFKKAIDGSSGESKDDEQKKS